MRRGASGAGGQSLCGAKGVVTPGTWCHTRRSCGRVLHVAASQLHGQPSWLARQRPSIRAGVGVRRAGTAGPTRPSCVGSAPATLSRILPNGPKTVRDVCSMCVVCVAHPTAPVAIWESNEYCNAQPSWGVTALQRTVLATTACLVWNHVSEIAISDACILLANAFLEVIGGLTSETASHALRDRSITATAIATLRAWPHPSRSVSPTRPCPDSKPDHDLCLLGFWPRYRALLDSAIPSSRRTLCWPKLSAHAAAHAPSGTRRAALFRRRRAAPQPSSLAPADLSLRPQPHSRRSAPRRRSRSAHLRALFRLRSPPSPGSRSPSPPSLSPSP